MKFDPVTPEFATNVALKLRHSYEARGIPALPEEAAPMVFIGAQNAHEEIMALTKRVEADQAAVNRLAEIAEEIEKMQAELRETMAKLGA